MICRILQEGDELDTNRYLMTTTIPVVITTRIMSPFLFNVYTDDLSVNLKECPTGCIAGGTIVNHLMYADDIVLLSPSATRLSLLLHVFGKYGLEHDIRFKEEMKRLRK